MRVQAFLGLIFTLCVACSRDARPAESSHQAPATRSSPFEYVGQSWMRFDATIADSVHTRLILDTGGGVTLLSQTLCERVGCVADGTYAGKRMSGQELQLPMARVASIVVAGRRVENVRVAVLDTTSLLHPELGVEGFVGLDVFRDQPFTIEYASHQLVLEDAATLSARRAAGQASHVRVEDDGTSAVVFLPLQLSSDGVPLEMEVDSGSRSLILDERFMSTLGIRPDGEGVRRVEDSDETDHPYVRYFASLPRDLPIPGAAGIIVPAHATVMFQSIIHDGLVGHEFLSAHTVTFDLPRAEMIFSRAN